MCIWAKGIMFFHCAPIWSVTKYVVFSVMHFSFAVEPVQQFQTWPSFTYMGNQIWCREIHVDPCGLDITWMDVVSVQIFSSSVNPLPAPLSPSHTVQTLGDSGSKRSSSLSHASTSVFTWNPTQHHDVGSTRAPQNPETLEPQLPQTSTSTQTLSRSVL